MKVKGYSRSVIGGRAINQDSCLVDDNKRLYAVADGVGGGLRGEVASKMAVEGLQSLCGDTGSLVPVIEQLQEAVLAEALSSLGEAFMGTTLTAVRVNEGTITIGHVGDSRCYLFDGVELKALTNDHEITDEATQATVLASYLGIPTDVHPITIQDETVSVFPGNRLLLCSDGLYRQMSHQRVFEIIKENLATPEALTELLCTEAALVDYSDNITVVFVEIE